MIQIKWSYDASWLLRYWLGFMMMYHSYEPLWITGVDGFAGYVDSLGLPWPTALAYMAKVSEFFGGLLLILNIATRMAAGFIIIVMLVAVFVAHKGLITTEAELAFNYLLIAVILFCRPSIPFRLFGKQAASEY